MTMPSTTSNLALESEMEGESSFSPLTDVCKDGKDACFEGIPPLDQVTVSSANDDTSSVSSVSTVASASLSSYRGNQRTIFGSYWKKSGNKKAPKRLLTPPNEVVTCRMSRCENPLEEDSTTSFESVTRQNPSYSEAKGNPRRRRIFGHGVMSESAPTLPALLEQRELRKTQSTSALKRSGSLRSSLRSSERERRLLDASVTFSPTVDVRVFETPSVQWAAKGWSNWFA